MLCGYYLGRAVFSGAGDSLGVEVNMTDAERQKIKEIQQGYIWMGLAVARLNRFFTDEERQLLAAFANSFVSRHNLSIANLFPDSADAVSYTHLTLPTS